MNFFVLEPVILFVCFIFIFYVHGTFFSQGLLIKSPWPAKFFTNVILGFGFVVVVLFYISLFNLLTKEILLITFSIAPIVFLIKNTSIRPFHVGIGNLYKGLIAHAGLIFIILYLLTPEAYRLFFPETTSDAMRYHLPYARFYAENQGLAVNEFLRYPLFSHNIDLVFSLGYVFQKDGQAEIFARLFNFFSVALLCFGLYSLIAKSFNKLMAILACFLILNVQLVQIYMVSGYIDFGLGLFLFACVYFLYQWQEQKQNKWLVFSAAMFGLALGTKYLALLWFVPVLFWVYISDKNWKNTLQFFIVALVIGCTWYIRNIIISGNPIHPFAQDVFGFWLWTPNDVIGQNQDLLERHGVARTFLNLVKLPWLLGTDKSFSYDNLGWFLIAGIPLMLCAFKMQRFYKHMAAFIFLNLIFWFYSSQILRYFYSLLPLLAIFAAYPFGLIYEKISSYKIFNNNYLVHILAICLIVYPANKVIQIYINLNNWKSLPTSPYDWESYLFKTNPDYQFSKVLNELGAKRVLKFGQERLQNTFKGLVLGDWFGVVNMREISDNANSVNDIVQTMNRINTRFIIANKNQMFSRKVIDLLENENRFTILKESDKTILYRLDDLFDNQ